MAIFKKLDFTPPLTYTVNSKRSFKSLFSLNHFLPQAFDFAYRMCFTPEGHHRDHRTGGQAHRSREERFINTLQGKLAEFGVHKKFNEAGIILPEPDQSIMGKGIWDDGDFEYNGNKLSIKSAAHFSHLMLLEAQDWDEQGNYIPNIDNGSANSDYFILCRIKPDGKTLLAGHSAFSIDPIDIELLQSLLFKEDWEFDMAGCIGRGELKQLISDKFILPQGAKLNGKITMDATNYYVQSGDMHTFDQLLKKLAKATQP